MSSNSQSIFAQLGASNHYKGQRQEVDYYATDPRMAEELTKLVELRNVWECACGEGHLAKVFDQYGLLGRASDLYPRGYGETGINFLEQRATWYGDIVTNPPYKYAQDFVEHALDLTAEGHYICMFLKIQFLEGKSRYPLFKRRPPIKIAVSVKRVQCAKNGDFIKYPLTGGAACYAWFIWKKGTRPDWGAPRLEWFNA